MGDSARRNLVDQNDRCIIINAIGKHHEYSGSRSNFFPRQKKKTGIA